MKDKNLVYAGYPRGQGVHGQSPSKKFKRVKILFEDDISYYVESLINQDKKGFGLRFSVKKHCFLLIAIDVDRTPELCKTCPLYTAFLKMRNKQ